uniref:Uncharacterized protein n=1 Tax=Peronospora matthiolae TaxID=2874970 RepID=A0AAV1SXG2_9STRA
MFVVDSTRPFDSTLPHPDEATTEREQGAGSDDKDA